MGKALVTLKTFFSF